MGITFNAPTNTITVTGTYTDNLFDSIFAADTAGGWGVFFKPVVSPSGFKSQYYSDAKIQIGDGSTATACSDSDCQVLFTNNLTTTANDGCIRVKASASLTLGLLVNATTKSTRSGCAFRSWETASGIRIILGEANSIVYIYSCHFTGNAYINARIVLGGSDNRFWNCVCACYVAFGDCSNLDLYNTQLSSADYGIFRCTGTFDKLVIQNETYAFLASSGISFNVSNATISDCTNLANIGSAVNNYLIDCTCNAWTFNFGAAGAVYRQYTFNCLVVDASGTAINGATVTLEDNASNVVFSVNTNASGVIAEQTVSRGYYAQATGNTLQDYGDFTLTIEKAGYVTYIDDGFVLDKPIDIRVSLLDALDGSALAGDVVSGETFYNTDPRTKLTGTYAPQSTGGGGSGRIRTRTKYVTVPSELEEPLMMATASLIIENQKLRRKK